MSRDLPPGFAAAAAAPLVLPVFLVELDWPGGTVYAWNGYGDILWNGQTWIGTGHLGTISNVRESQEGGANGVTLTLSGVPSGNIANALAANAQNRPGRIYFGIMTTAGTFAVEPYLKFDGLIDVCPIQDSGETATISVQLEKELIDQRTHGRRYTHEDQQIDHPGDLGFEYVAGLAEKEIMWGAEKVAPAVPDESAVVDVES